MPCSNAFARLLDRTIAFQIVSTLMAATIHGHIYTSLRHFIVIDTTNLPFASADT
jgi:hypothetical protein